MSLPLVSVWMITYNHSDFVDTALDSILKQKVNFEYEIVIGEDFSTDGTRKRLELYKKRYPNKINILMHRQNIGMHKNVIETLNACRGQFIAMCEGDDYWEDERKLQKQVDFLQNNPDFVLTCGKAKVLNNADNKIIGTRFIYTKSKEIGLETMAMNNYIPTCTVIFRNVSIQNRFGKAFFEVISCDWYIYFLLSEYGKFWFMDEVFGVYRLNEHSVNGRTDDLKIIKKEIKLLNLLHSGMIRQLSDSEKKMVKRGIGHKYLGLSRVYRSNSEYLRAFSSFFSGIRKKGISPRYLKSYFAGFLTLIHPGLSFFVFRWLGKIKRIFLVW